MNQLKVNRQQTVNVIYPSHHAKLQIFQKCIMNLYKQMYPKSFYEIAILLDKEQQMPKNYTFLKITARSMVLQS